MAGREQNGWLKVFVGYYANVLGGVYGGSRCYSVDDLFSALTCGLRNVGNHKIIYFIPGAHRVLRNMICNKRALEVSGP